MEERYQGLGLPTSDYNHLSPRPYREREHPLPRLTEVFAEVLILVSQSSQGCSYDSVSLLLFHILFLFYCYSIITRTAIHVWHRPLFESRHLQAGRLRQ